MSWTSFDCFKYVQFASCVQVVSSYRTRKNNSIFTTEFKNKVHDRKSLYGVTLKTWSTSVFTDNIWTTFFVSLINFSVFPLLQNHPSQIIVFKGYGGRDFDIGEILFPGTIMGCIIMGCEFMDKECIKLLQSCCFLVSYSWVK